MKKSIKTSKIAFSQFWQNFKAHSKFSHVWNLITKLGDKIKLAALLLQFSTGLI